jgi:hypothetical protein
MRAHLRYLKYVLRHKWFVFLACLRYGLVWQGLIHDWQKFTRAEWTPYVLSFYGPWKYKERPQWLVDAFDAAWLHHQHYGPHHWQYWILRNDSGPTRVLEMPMRYRKEMIADWIGAGRALGKYQPAAPMAEVRAWYTANRDKILLADQTREWVERELA